ncbi:hypothetical protein CEXT_732021 [Caerostris extrusa]|uniref:Uncharacterized protein n=1 Tax=Caerostris extrusa TaxID=172846 RepID=A0AAV4T1J1_CAEEX|nr:hypothetical protein CEXT_732021 [Caerostris extrusa]
MIPQLVWLKNIPWRGREGANERTVLISISKSIIAFRIPFPPRPKEGFATGQVHRGLYQMVHRGLYQMSIERFVSMVSNVHRGLYQWYQMVYQMVHRGLYQCPQRFVSNAHRGLYQMVHRGLYQMVHRGLYQMVHRGLYQMSIEVCIKCP